MNEMQNGERILLETIVSDMAEIRQVNGKIFDKIEELTDKKINPMQRKLDQHTIWFKVLGIIVVVLIGATIAIITGEKNVAVAILGLIK